ncbi:MAG: TolC family protein, partial [Colwellia sp.]|nr:TolC family protein [Colwellia sp.]
MKLPFLLIALVLAIFVSACAQQPQPPNTLEDLNLSPSFVNSGTGQFNERWWQSFNDDTLSTIVEQALSQNLTLKANDMLTKIALLGVDVAGSSAYPTISLNANAGSDISKLSKIDSASIGLSSAWEIDLWGQLAAVEQKAVWEHHNQQSIYRAKANLVSSGVVSAWLGQSSELEKYSVLSNQYRRTEIALKVITRRFAMGKNSVTDIWQQQKLLKSIEVQQAKNQANLVFYKQKLALWLGITTEELTLENKQSLPNLPQLPTLGVPLDALRLRPDIQQAYSKIKVANEDLAIAIADQLPRLTLRANYSTSKATSRDLFDDWAGNLIASIALPILDAGKRASIVKQRQLSTQALFAKYKETWLAAINEVNKAITSEVHLLEVVKNLEMQLDLAQKTEHLTTVKYLNGKTNYINL